MMIGGNTISEYLLGLMEKDSYQVTILEEDADRCRELMDRFPGAKCCVPGKGSCWRS